MTFRLRAGIIGAGRIGWRYDGGRWDGQRSVSHAACLDRHSDTDLVALLDPDPSACADAATALGPGVRITDREDGFFGLGLDLVCIASPTALHADHLRACMARGVRYVLMEKPVTVDLEGYRALLADWAAQVSPPRVCINYFRRVLPHVAALRAACQARAPRGIDVIFSRGLAVNGVHLLDLVGYLLDANSAPALDWVDGPLENPSFALTLGGVTVSFRGFDLPYHCIELRATFDDGRLSLLDGGIRLEHEAREENPDYPGFYHLAAPRPLLDPEETARAMRDGTYHSLCNLLDEGQPVASSLHSAGFAQELLARVGATR